jgi:hypothetical protein
MIGPVISTTHLGRLAMSLPMGVISKSRVDKWLRSFRYSYGVDFGLVEGEMSTVPQKLRDISNRRASAQQLYIFKKGKNRKRRKLLTAFSDIIIRMWIEAPERLFVQETTFQ